MIEILQYDFIQNALIAGILVSLLSGIIGSLIVVNRIVFLAGGIAHTAYAGIGAAIFFGFGIFFGASVVAIIAALFVAKISLENPSKLDTFIGLVWAVGMAIGIIFIDLSDGYNVDLMSYLFGSILAVSSSDIIYITLLLTGVVLFIIGFYKQLLAVSYDKEYANLSGINSKFFYSTILVLSALSVVVAIKVVGLILVIALLTIPIYIAEKLSSSLIGMMIISGILSSLFTVIGLFLSYQYDLTAGATIILTSATFMGLFEAKNIIKS